MEKLRTKTIGWRIHAIFFLLLCMGCPSLQAQDPSLVYPVPISEIYFPDETFRTWVQEQDKDDDGNLSLAECRIVTSCNIASKGIRSIEGIEYFYALEDLDCSNNEIEKIDISKNIDLVCVDVSDNQLKSLSVFQNEKLEVLDCSNNQLKSLNLHWNEYLKSINCSYNLITSLTLYHSLEFLDCSNNQLKEIIMEREYDNWGSAVQKDVDTLICSHNQLSSLVLYFGFKVLDCSWNGMERLELPDFPDGVRIDCSHNRISGCLFHIHDDYNYNGWGTGAWEGRLIHSLDCSYNNLWTLGISKGNVLNMAAYIGNQIEHLNCSNNDIESLSTSCAKNLDCSNNNINSLYVSSSVLQNLDYTDNPLSDLTLINCPASVSVKNFDEYLVGLTDLTLVQFPIDALNFPMESRIENLEIQDCPSLANIECLGTPLKTLAVNGCANLSSIDVGASALEELTLSDCENLYSLNCSHTRLKELNASGLPSLSTIDCSYNNDLEKIDASNCGNLMELDCQNGALKSLSIANCGKLRSLDCSSNSLQVLDLTTNSGLVHLNCASNQVSVLELRNCKNLSKIDCRNNEIERLYVASFPELSYLDCSHNPMTALDAGNCASLDTLYCANGDLASLNVANDTLLRVLDCSNNQLNKLDVGFFSRLEDLGFVENPLEYLDVSGIRLDSLDCSNLRLTNLRMDECDSMRFVDCSNNQLVSIDISSCANLASLDCSNNQLVSIDISSCANLASLDCSNNQLESIDISGCPDLTSLDCSNNRLTGNLYCADRNMVYLDFSNNQLDSVDCSNNQLATLNVEKSPSLSFLDCSRNQLSKLSFGNDYGVFRYLDCSRNRLTNLNCHACSDLKILDCSNNQLEDFYLDSDAQLDSIDCSNNHLRTIDAIVNTRYLDCSHNKLEHFSLFGFSEPLDDLEFLDCSDNLLACIDRTDAGGIIEMPNLKFLKCDNNPLQNNFLAGDYPSLEYLDCSEGELTGFSLSDRVPVLQVLNCSSNRLDSIDVSNNVALQALNCSNNRLTGMDLSNNVALQALNCSNNRLTGMNLSNNVDLQTLNCSNNHLTGLDLSNNLALRDLDFSNNRLACMDLSLHENIESIIDSNNYYFLYLGAGNACDIDSIPGFDLGRVSSVEGGAIENQTLVFHADTLSYSYDYRCPAMERKGIFHLIGEARIPVDSTHFPDPAFLQYVSEIIDISGDDYLSEDEIEFVTYMDVSDRGIRSLQGLEYFSWLQELFCQDNMLTSIDLSQNPLVERLNTENNHTYVLTGDDRTFNLNSLPGFDVSKASDWIGGKVQDTVLTFEQEEVSYLYNTGYQGHTRLPDVRFFLATEIPADIAPVNDSTFPDLIFRNYVSEHIDLSRNGILNAKEVESVKHLDVSNLGIRSLQGIEYFTGLESLDCSGNELTSLDLSKNANLQELDAEDNGREVAIADDNGFELSSLPGFEPGRASGWQGGRVEAGTLYFESREVSYAYALGRTLSSGESTVRFRLRASQPLFVCELDEQNFPDSAFRSVVASQVDTNGDNRLDSDEIARIISLDVSNLGIRSLQGIEYFTGLESLDCSGNELTSLDLSKNANLQELDAEDNGREVAIADDNGFELSSLPGFEPGRASGWQGGRVEAGTLYFESREVSYAYALGRTLSSGESTVRFRLRASQPLFVCELDEQNFPDSAFRSVVASQVDTNGDNRLDSDEIARIISLDVSNLGIRSLQGIEYFTGLESLDCSGNELTSLSLSANTRLQFLDAENNQLDVVLDERNRFDRSGLLGFEIAKTSDWEGCTRIGNYLTFTQQEVTYSYATDYIGSSTDARLKSVRFSLMADRDPSVYNEAATDNAMVRVYAKDRIICTEGICGEVSVFTTTGRLVYQGRQNRIPVQLPGMYMLRHGGQVWKVLVM